MSFIVSLYFYELQKEMFECLKCLNVCSTEHVNSVVHIYLKNLITLYCHWIYFSSLFSQFILRKYDRLKPQRSFTLFLLARYY